jgi:hypothetical protein
MLEDPTLPLLARGPKNYRAWPKALCPGRIEYLPLSRLLTMHHAGDAHIAAYSAPSVPHRLGTDPPAYARIDGGVPMSVFLFDVDCAASHRALGGTGAVHADDAWWGALCRRLDALDVEHPGAFCYRTRGGARVIYRLPTPHLIVDGLGEIAWKRLYLSRLAYLARRFGIAADPSISDWPRVIRLPHVTRDGVFTRAEIRGDAWDVGALGYDPGGNDDRADLDFARSLGPTWAPALRILARNAEAPVRAPRAPRAVATRDAVDPGVWATLAEDLGRALRRHHGRHGVHLALAGACYARGVPLERGPELARAICAASGESDDRPQVWQTTADRVRGGQGVTGYGYLAQHWPDLAAIVDTAFPAEGGARALRDELDARGTLATVAAPEAAPRVRAAIEAAPPGLSVVRVTEGAGKTRTAIDVLRARAEAVGDREAVPSQLKTLYVASSHAVALEVAGALRGLRGEYLRGVLSVRDAGGEPACHYHVPLARLTGARHAAATWCEGKHLGPKGTDAPCPHLDGCAARAGTVIPLGGVGTPAVVVTVHALLAQGLAWAGNDALVVIDEDPQAVESVALTRDALESAAGAEVHFARSERWRAPVLRALAAGLERGDLPRGADALQQVFTRGAESLLGDVAWCDAVKAAYPVPDCDDVMAPGDILHDYAIRAAWSESRERPTKANPSPPSTWRRRSAWAPRPSQMEHGRVFSGQPSERFVTASATHAQVARLAAGILRSSPPDVDGHAERGVAAVEVAFPDTTRRVLRGIMASPAVAAAMQRGGPTVLLDATADVAVVRALAAHTGYLPDSHVTDVRVADGALVTRRVLYWADATRKTALDGGVVRWAEGLGRYVRASLAQVADAGARSVGLFTWKALADVLDAAVRGVDGADPTARAIVADARARGVELVVGHYGHARGRNDWSACDALVSVGDPRPNVGSSRAIAAVLGLADDHAEVYRRATAAEVSQVAGRLRAPWRTAPALHVHVGTVVPASWDARAEVLDLALGPAEVFDPARIYDAVRVFGSARVGAAAAGVGRWTAAMTAARVRRDENGRETTESNENPFVEGSHTPCGVPPSKSITGTHPTACDTLPTSGFSENTPPTALIAAAGGAVAVAALLGVSRPTAYHWASGARPMPADARQRLASALATPATASDPTPTPPAPPATAQRAPLRFVAPTVPMEKAHGF